MRENYIKTRGKYQEKLRDPRWQKIRLEIFDRDKWTCQLCFDSESTLAVHHKYYKNGLEPWDYPPEALITLCEECHQEESEIRPQEEQTLLYTLKAKGFFAGDVLNLAIGIDRLKPLHSLEVLASVYSWALENPTIQKELIDKYFEWLKNKRTKNG